MAELTQIISRQIELRGPMPFAKFMELALYCPVYGYYEKEGDTVGGAGDYVTSVCVGGLFGELLAFQFAEWLGTLQTNVSPADGPVQIVEAGAHRGDLAKDILGWMLRHRPDLYQRLDYVIIEPSDRRQGWQRESLAEFEGKVQWSRDMADPTQALQVRGVIFCNELLDALPVRRWGWDASQRAWFEWGVTRENGRFAWTRMGNDPCEAGPEGFEQELLEVLPDGYIVETCPAAERWWQVAASALAGGKLVAFDYGMAAEELFRPERKSGTLRGYRRHRVNSDVLAEPGLRDITAHVNFTAIERVGLAAGLRTEVFVAQARFLSGIAARDVAGGGVLGEWTPERARQFQTLTHPDHLGGAFRVLVQSRGS